MDKAIPEMTMSKLMSNISDGPETYFSIALFFQWTLSLMAAINVDMKKK